MSDANGTATNAKTLSCQICDKCFTRPENLARHMKTHNSNQKHKCEPCGRQFTRSDLLKKHERIHDRGVSKPRVRQLSRSTSSSQVSPMTAIVPSSPTTVSLVGDNAALLASAETSHHSGRAQAVSMVSSENHNASLDPQAEPRQPTQSVIQGSWTDPVDFDPYFDYTTFARPWNYHLDHSADLPDWLSSQFFAALRETDLTYSPPPQAWGAGEYWPTDDAQGNNNLAPPCALLHLEGSSELSRSENLQHPFSHSSEGSSGRVSRVTSPPNESSYEDQLPFAWDPRSTRVVRAKPIVLSADDPIFANLDPNVAISQASLSSIKTFLRPLSSTSGDDAFTLPELPLFNVFVSLFLRRFAVQAPVLHRPTLDFEMLPPALLAIMMVIGSCYSRLRGTRRFGIIVFDRLRQNLLALIEDDNRLMREPMIIYATALVCYMGLWCGNKRAFELSEALRAVVVTYIRRLPLNQDHEIHKRHRTDVCRSSGSVPDARTHSTAQSQWLRWATRETEKRLRWFVYTIDSQFPAILGMSGMLSIADVRKWECPCDETFWTLATPRAWKNRLGSASEPCCPVFGSLSALLLFTTERPTQSELLPAISPWSANLLMAALMSEVFVYQETLVVMRTYQDEGAVPSLCSQTDSRAAHLIAMLNIWQISYNQRQPGRLDATSAHLQRCSTVMYHLACIYMVFPIADIQDCLGRSGSTDAGLAMGRLGTWITNCPEPAMLALQDASICISIILANKSDSDPYDLIGLFLCHVVIWSYAHAATTLQKMSMLQRLRDQDNVTQSVIEVIEAGFSLFSTSDATIPHPPQLVFRHAIQALVQQGTWGASANLALLLHLHPGLSE